METKKQKVISLLRQALKGGKLKELMDEVDVTVDDKNIIVDFKRLATELEKLAKSNEVLISKMDTLIEGGLKVTNLEEAKDDFGEIKANSEAVQMLRDDVNTLIKSQIVQGTKDTQGVIEVVSAVFSAMVQFFTGIFKTTIFKSQLLPEHYMTPQTMIVLDPYTGKPVDWSRLGTAQKMIPGGGFSAVQVPGASSVVSVAVTGTIDGANDTFTLSSAPSNGLLYLSLGRQEQVEGTDFTRSGSTITYTTPPAVELAAEPHRAIIY